MKTARVFTLKDYPHPDNDEAGQTILWVSEVDDWDNDEAVVVEACEEGWREVLGAVAVV